MRCAGRCGTACESCVERIKGSALSERSEFAETPLDATFAGKPEGPVTPAGATHTARRRSPQPRIRR